MKIWVDLILCYRKNAGPTNLQRSENNNQIDPSKAKQDERTPEKNKSFVEETRNNEDSVLYFRGEGCNIPLLCPRISCKFCI